MGKRIKLTMRAARLGGTDARARLADANHTAAVELLAQIDARLSATLARALSRKTQAAYETRGISATDASACVRQATALLEQARSRVRPT